MSCPFCRVCLPLPTDFISLLLNPDFLLVAIEVSRWILFGTENEAKEKSSRVRENLQDDRVLDDFISAIPSSSLPTLSTIPPPVAALILYTALCDSGSISACCCNRDSEAGGCNRGDLGKDLVASKESLDHSKAHFFFSLSPSHYILSDDELQAMLCLSSSPSISSSAAAFFSIQTQPDVNCQSHIAALQLSSTQKLCREVVQRFPQIFSLLVQELPWSPPDIPWRIDLSDQNNSMTCAKNLSNHSSEVREQKGNLENKKSASIGCTNTEKASELEVNFTPRDPFACYERKENPPVNSNIQKNTEPEFANINTEADAPLFSKHYLASLQAGVGVPSMISHYDYMQQNYPDYEEGLKLREKELECCFISSILKYAYPR